MTDRSAPANELDLMEFLTESTPETTAAVKQLDGDILVLGASGKVGPSLALLIQRSLAAARSAHRMVCVSRFSDASAGMALARAGIRTISADLLDRKSLERLPDCPYVYFLAGMKFGSNAQPATTWAINTLMPALVAERFRESRIVVLSTGNVYPFVPPTSGGATEDTPPEPIGEYAQSCLGRERMFEHMAAIHGTKTLLVRLNYATDLRYGVLVDVAQAIVERRPIDLSMGYVNTIWQGDANSALVRALPLCANPPAILNLTGPDVVSIRSAAEEMARLMHVHPPQFVGSESPTALLANASRCVAEFGPPAVPTAQIIEWTAKWVQAGGPTLGKATHFQTKDGRF